MKYIILFAVVIIIVLDIVIVDLIARYSCDRYCPKLPDFLSQGLVGKKAGKTKRVSESRIRAEKLKETADIRYEIMSEDGLKLVANYYPKENAKRIVIALHGWRSSWNYDFNGQYSFLHNEGCSIFFPQARSHGESEGRYMYYGKKEYDDLKRWIIFIRSHISKDLPIYLYGMSAGGGTAIMTSPYVKDMGVCGVIADSASTSARDAGKMTIKNIHLSPLIFYSQVRLDCYLRIGMDDNEFTPLDAIKKSEIPILIIYGSKDKLAPENMAKSLYNACNAPKEIMKFENAGHMKSFYTDPERYKKAVLKFFDENEKILA